MNKPVTGGEDGLGEYEPTTKVLSVVNSVEMEGAEKYLVVGNKSSQLAAFLISLPEPRCPSGR